MYLPPRYFRTVGATRARCKHWKDPGLDIWHSATCPVITLAPRALALAGWLPQQGWVGACADPGYSARCAPVLRYEYSALTPAPLLTSRIDSDDTYNIFGFVTGRCLKIDPQRLLAAVVAAKAVPQCRINTSNMQSGTSFTSKAQVQRSKKAPSSRYNASICSGHDFEHRCGNELLSRFPCTCVCYASALLTFSVSVA